MEVEEVTNDGVVKKISKKQKEKKIQRNITRKKNYHLNNG